MRWAGWVVFCGLAAAQTVAPSREISRIEGRGELLRFQNDISRVVISEPKVADAVVVSPREVMVNAKGPGRTTLVVWEAGAEPAQWEIAVGKDMADWEAFRKHIVDSANGDPITVTGTGETIVLTGSVKSAMGCEPLAGAAGSGAATDPAASEVRGDRPGGAVADRVQPVQHER
jgi:pilus assembly protein CpaC